MIRLRWIHNHKKYLFSYVIKSKRAVDRYFSSKSNCLRIPTSLDHQQCHKNNNKWSVLFYGTDTFSLESLRRLQNLLSTDLLSKLEVVSSLNPVRENDVVQFARQHDIKIHSWPIEFPICEFDIGIVVSFGHLIPKHIIESFPLGMINVHASLLPRWRGAAPIVYSLIHGDTTTGISIIRIMPNKFDIGDVLAQTSIPIHPDETQLELHHKMACIGGDLLVKTVEQLPQIIHEGQPQSQDRVTYAPKISKTLSLIHWDKMTAIDVYNLQRALIGIYPLTTYCNGQKLKLHGIQRCDGLKFNSSGVVPGLVSYDKRRGLIVVQCLDGEWVSVEEISLVQRRKMAASDFHNGFMNNYRERRMIFTSKNITN